jgi:hypothetical protein
MEDIYQVLILKIKIIENVLFFPEYPGVISKIRIK